MGVMIRRHLTPKECRNEGWFCGDCGNCCTGSMQKERGDEGISSGYWRICTDDVTLSIGSRLHSVCLNSLKLSQVHSRITSFSGCSCRYTRFCFIPTSCLATAGSQEEWTQCLDLLELLHLRRLADIAAFTATLLACGKAGNVERFRMVQDMTNLH